MDKDQRKLNENTIDSELCEFCGKTFRKCNLLQHQRSRGCMKKEKTASELGNRSILEFFQIVSCYKLITVTVLNVNNSFLKRALS